MGEKGHGNENGDGAASLHERKRTRTRGGEALIFNAIAAVFLATLLGLAIFVSGKPVVATSRPATGWSTISATSTTSWNVGVVVAGTAVGIFASVAFSSQDAFLSRMHLASPGGIAAIFLRPLTTKRSFDQILAGQLGPERTALVILTLATTLTSAATVALFSIQTFTEEVTNLRASYPLSALNGTFFRTLNGGVFPVGSPALETSGYAAPVSSFFYRSSFINGQIAETGEHNTAPGIGGPFLPLEGPLGETTFADLWTTGVGTHVKSYLTYQGPVGHFLLPSNYSFISLQGQVFATVVNVTCEDATDEYARQRVVLSGSDFRTTTARKIGAPERSPNITVVSGTRVIDPFTPAGGSLAIASNVSLSSRTATPTHVFLAAGFLDNEGAVFECTYSGREVVVEVSVDSPSAPLVVGRILDEGPLIGPAVKRLLAQSLHQYLGSTSGGGVLTRGFVDAGYNDEAGDLRDGKFANVLGTVLSQASQALISSMRQTVEIANAYDPPEVQATFLTMRMLVQRLGGGQVGWVVVYAVLLAGCLLGLVRAAVGGEAVGFEAQDAVVLLAQVEGNESLKAKERVRFVPGTGMVGAATGEPIRRRHVGAEMT